MRTNTKKFATLFFALIMILSLAATASAVSPRGATCDNCGVGEVVYVDNVKTPLGVIGKVACKHGFVYGEDLILSQLSITTWRCNRCGESFTSEFKEQTYECHGYDYKP